MDWWIEAAGASLLRSSRWMSWNLFLAFVPFGLSFYLFRGQPRRSLFWWLILLIFVAFLPNAPYVLTDLIHLVREIQGNQTLWFNILVVIPKYVVFVILGFGAYVLALVNMGHYLQRQGLRRAIWQAELGLHGLSAIGVYLGRFERLNSWYLVTRLHQVVDTIPELLERRPIIITGVIFLIFAGLYWLLKEVTLAILLRHRYYLALKQLARQEVTLQ